MTLTLTEVSLSTYFDKLLKRYPGVVRAETRKANLEDAAYKRASKGRRRKLSRQPFERLKP